LSESSKVNRRRFLKYVGAGAVAVGGAAAYYLHNTSLRNPEVTIPTTATTTTSTNQNHPPVANFKYKPYYLDPTDQQTIKFTSNCYDADNDPLTYSWYVDDNRASEQKDYSTVLTKGDHVVRLEVSDGISHDDVQQTVTVEPDQIYPIKPLRLSFKGISYSAGTLTPEWCCLPPPNQGADG